MSTITIGQSSGFAEAPRPLSLSDVVERCAGRQNECVRFVEELREVGIPLNLRRYSAGNVLYTRSYGGGILRVLRKGAIKVFTPYFGGKCFARLIGPWETFDKPFLRLDGKSLEGWAEAATDCEVLEVAGCFLPRAARQLPALTLRLATLREFELAELQDHLEVLRARKTRSKLTCLLTLLVGKFGERSSAELPVSIGLRLTHSDLSQMIAVTRESTTAALNVLRREGLIKMEHQRISVVDLDGLAQR
jgi:CRP/FNR family transcriptional regulator, cyclic AMP receptor protein